MLNLFSQNSLLKEGLSSVLLITILLLVGGYIFFSPKPAQALVPDIIGGVPNIIKMLWAFVSDSMDRIKQVAQAAYAAVSAAYDKWMKSESILAQATRIAAQVALYQILN
ncbi:hypothetical protein KKD72_03030, partial [Patescibacteria group bacterium]|nr:hypothetical protein [Patescibacteria group bacterium]